MSTFWPSHLSENAQAILLLTQPLLAQRRKKGRGRRRTSARQGELYRGGQVTPLDPKRYGQLAERLHRAGHTPADLLGPGADAVLQRCGMAPRAATIMRLLNRGFLLSLALEKWRNRAIWVVTRADQEYPRTLKRRLRANAPPVLYGRGNKELLTKGGLALVGNASRTNAHLQRFITNTVSLAAQAQCTVLSTTSDGVGRSAIGGALHAGGTAATVLSGNLRHVVLDQFFIPHFATRRLVICSPVDPTMAPVARGVLDANACAWALADAVLVTSLEQLDSATHRSIHQQLQAEHGQAIFLRQDIEPNLKMTILQRSGARWWPVPRAPREFRLLLEEAARESSRKNPPTNQRSRTNSQAALQSTSGSVRATRYEHAAPPSPKAATPEAPEKEPLADTKRSSSDRKYPDESSEGADSLHAKSDLETSPIPTAPERDLRPRTDSRAAPPAIDPVPRLQGESALFASQDATIAETTEKETAADEECPGLDLKNLDKSPKNAVSDHSSRDAETSLPPSAQGAKQKKIVSVQRKIVFDQGDPGEAQH